MIVAGTLIFGWYTRPKRLTLGQGIHIAVRPEPEGFFSRWWERAHYAGWYLTRPFLTVWNYMLGRPYTALYLRIAAQDARALYWACRDGAEFSSSAPDAPVGSRPCRRVGGPCAGRPMFTSLNSKLVAIMLILSLSLVTVLVLFYRHTEKALYADFERQTAELSEAIRIGVQELSRKGAYSDQSLKTALARLNIKGVTEISVISTSNRVLASTDPEEVGKWLTRSRRELIVRAEMGQPVTSEEKFFDVVIPVASEGVTLGYIHLRMSTEAFSVFMRTSAIRRIAAALFICVLGTGLAWVLARWYTKPIETMVRAARRVASGDLQCDLPMDRRDEIGQLAQNFNYMIGKLREDRDLREKLRRAEHLAGIGQFSRSIAHEIKNPLNFISLGIDHMQEAYRPDSTRDDGRFDSLLENMKKEIQRVEPVRRKLPGVRQVAGAEPGRHRYGRPDRHRVGPGGGEGRQGGGGNRPRVGRAAPRPAG